jgi:hypothetical protein
LIQVFQITTLKFQSYTTLNERTVYLKKSYKIVRPINDTNKEYLNYLLEIQSWENLYKQTSVNAACSGFLDIFYYSYKTAMPKLRVRILQDNRSWITTGIKKSRRRLKMLRSVI